MPDWVDLRAHGLTLLAQFEPAGDKIRALVIRRLRPDAEIPIEAVTYGFAQRAGEFVRTGAEFSLPAIRRLFPRSRVTDFPVSAITYRRSAAIVSLYPSRALSARGDEGASFSDWALIPLPRFQLEAEAAWVGGRLLVLQGKHEHQTQRRDDPAAAKAEAHRDAVSKALELGAELPCEVLVDYADMVYWGTRHGHAAVRAAHLLARLGVTEKLLHGDSGYLVLAHPHQPALHIERIVSQDGMRLAFTHYQHRRDHAPSIHGEVIFTIRAGRLFLAETATLSSDGTEVRGFDTHFANAFTQALLANGYDLARLSWSEESARRREHMYGREVAALLEQHDATITPIQDGAYAGMFMAAGPDAQGCLQTALGMSAFGAAAALANQLSGHPTTQIRQLGLNLFRELLIQGHDAQRHRMTQDGPIAEPAEARGVEFMTLAEGLEVMALSRKSQTPVVGTRLFGRQVSRILAGPDERPIYFAIETKGTAVLAYHFVPYAGSYGWACLNQTWAGEEPSDEQLRASYARAANTAFDSDAFLAEVNATIGESNQDLEASHQLPELSPDLFQVVHPNATTYLLEFRDPQMPMVVAIEADGDLWRVCTSSAKSYQMPLGSACSSAASKLADARMNYLRRLHRGEDGGLRIGLPQADFDAFKRLLASVHAVGPMARPEWTAYKLRSIPPLLLQRLNVDEISAEVFQLHVRDTELGYTVFSLRLDPNATLADFEREGVHSVRQLVEQLHSDIDWTERLAGRRDQTALQDWISRYLELQIRHYGEQHLARVPSQLARDLVVALADRDAPALLLIIGREGCGHPSADRLFEEFSGVKLGDATPAREQAIRTWCGPGPSRAHRCELVPAPIPGAPQSISGR